MQTRNVETTLMDEKMGKIVRREKQFRTNAGLILGVSRKFLADGKPLIGKRGRIIEPLAQFDGAYKDHMRRDVLVRIKALITDPEGARLVDAVLAEMGTGRTGVDAWTPMVCPRCKKTLPAEAFSDGGSDVIEGKSSAEESEDESEDYTQDDYVEFEEVQVCNECYKKLKEQQRRDSAQEQRRARVHEWVQAQNPPVSPNLERPGTESFGRKGLRPGPLF